MGLRSFLRELKRRNVIRAAILYVGTIWALAPGRSSTPSIAAPKSFDVPTKVLEPALKPFADSSKGLGNATKPYGDKTKTF